MGKQPKDREGQTRGNAGIIISLNEAERNPDRI
jgi:hypothetical protein